MAAANPFVQATKESSLLRLAIHGPSKSGKTYTALLLGTGLGERVALIETEHGSAAKYADKFDFHECRLSNFHPAEYIKLIRAAEQGEFDVLIIDSLSHAWAGHGGLLEVLDSQKGSQGGNDWAGWSKVTPIQNSLIEALHTADLHIICTMRSRTEWRPAAKGRAPEKIGLDPVQRKGVEFEFDALIEMDMEHNMHSGGSRYSDLDGRVFKDAAEVVQILQAELSAGVAPAPKPEPAPQPKEPVGRDAEGFLKDNPPEPEGIGDEAAKRIHAQMLAAQKDLSLEAIDKVRDLARKFGQNKAAWTLAQAADMEMLISDLTAKHEAAQAEPAPAPDPETVDDNGQAGLGFDDEGMNQALAEMGATEIKEPAGEKVTV